MKIYKFSASWCNPCKMLSKTMSTLDIPYTEIDVDENEELTEKYNIRNVPVLLFTDDNGNEVKRLVGAVSKDVILTTYKELC